MSYLCQKCQDKACVNYTNFEILSLMIEHGLQWLIVKISKVSQRRQTISVMFCRNGSIA